MIRTSNVKKENQKKLVSERGREGGIEEEREREASDLHSSIDSQ